MSELVRLAFEEAASILDKENKRPPNPGPLYLLIKALAITVATYVASFRMLNVKRAAKEYDMRVPAIHNIASGTTPSARERANRFTFIIVAIIGLVTLIFLDVVVSTLEKPLSRIIYTSILKIGYALAAFFGFNTVLGLCFRLPKDISFLRLPVTDHAYPFIVQPKRPRSRRYYITRIALGATAVYTAIYPSQWLISLAIIGCGIKSALSLPPGFVHTLSLRGVIIAATVYFAIAILCFIVACTAKPPPKYEARDELNIDLDPFWDPSWRFFVLILTYQGIFIRALLTALVLRYEHGSFNTADPEVLGGSEPAHLAQSERSAPMASYSIEEAIAARVTIPHDRPRFSKPLFYVVLGGAFALHVPPIVFSTLSLNDSGFLNAEKHPLLGGLVWFFSVLPAEIWTIGFLPALVKIACLVRKDGTELWKYREVQVMPLMGASATSETMEADNKAKSRFMEQSLSTEAPF